jgi:predicted DNA-binding protein (UPF0251 family)
MSNMKKWSTIVLLALGAAACNEKKESMSQSEIDMKVDSLMAIRMQDMNMKYMEDLGNRMTIEVKAKADSITAARDAKNAPAAAPKDTAAAVRP